MVIKLKYFIFSLIKNYKGDNLFQKFTNHFDNPIHLIYDILYFKHNNQEYTKFRKFNFLQNNNS